MRIRLFIIALTLSVSGPALAQAYKWVDESGVVHYSDRPEPGAEVLDLPGRPAPIAAPAARTPAEGDPAAPEEPAPGYESLSVATPAAEVTLWNIEGTLDVSLSLQPGLKPGHQVRAYFDGEPRMVSGTSFQIDEVFRGVHNIQVEVVDETGQMLIRSRTNRFYVQQTRVVGQRPAGPAPR